MAYPQALSIRNREVERFVRFAVVGSVGTVVDFTILVVLKEVVGLPLLLANTTSYLAGVANNFTLNRLWTYPEARAKAVWRQFAQFLMVSTAGLILNNLIVSLLAEPLGDLLAYLQANTEGMRWMMAVQSSHQGAVYVLETGRGVMYMGGFSGQDPVVNAESLQAYVDAGELRYVLSGGADGVALSVKDTGAGIAPDDLPRIFERFYRGDASRHSDSGESGLGLAIVKSIVEAHGGTVRAESRVDEGTMITLTLPTATPHGSAV